MNQVLIFLKKNQHWQTFNKTEKKRENNQIRNQRITLLYTWNKHNIVKQLYSNTKIIVFK